MYANCTHNATPNNMGTLTWSLEKYGCTEFPGRYCICTCQHGHVEHSGWYCIDQRPKEMSTFLSCVSMDARPESIVHWCIFYWLEWFYILCFSVFQCLEQSIAQIKEEPSLGSHHHVPDSLSMNTVESASQKGTPRSTFHEKETKVYCLAFIWLSFTMQGVTGFAINLLMPPWNSGTKKQYYYLMYICKWIKFIQFQNEDVYNISVA